MESQLPAVNSSIHDTIIVNDFRVELLAKVCDTTIFGALRRGGMERFRTLSGLWETHTAGVWHLMTRTCMRREGAVINGLRQWHIPRFVMARAFDSLIKLNRDENSGPRPAHAPLVGGITMALLDGEAFAFSAVGTCPAFFRIPERVLSRMKRDVRILAKVREEVQAVRGGYRLPGLKTPNGHPVQSPSSALVQAIAFEAASIKELNAGNFGVYSAFCTARDFTTSRKMTKSLLKNLVAEQLQHRVDGLSDKIIRLYMEVQTHALQQPIWGPGIEPDLAHAVAILAEGMGRLSRHQRVQFMLMNGMHAAGLLLPLGVVSGIIGFEMYVEFMAQTYSADSPQEQDIRKEAAFMRLYGELACEEA